MPASATTDATGIWHFSGSTTMTSKQKTRLALAAALVVLALANQLLARCRDDAPPRGPHPVGEACRDGKLPAPFDRQSQFGGWKDQDGDCRNTRAEILQANSVERAEGGCSITRGAWYDPYTGDTIRHPRDLDIDHVVPLKEAWLSGAWEWTKSEREAFANDPEVLIAVGSKENRSKSDKDPAEWLPPNRAYRAEYARRWAAIKVRYRLSADPAELRALAALGVVELPREAPEGCEP